MYVCAFYNVSAILMNKYVYKELRSNTVLHVEQICDQIYLVAVLFAGVNSTFNYPAGKSNTS